MNEQYRDLVFVIRDLVWELFLCTEDGSAEEARVDLLFRYVCKRINEIENGAYGERDAEVRNLIKALNGLIVTTLTNVNRIGVDPDRPLSTILDTIRQACLEATEVADRAAGEYDE